MKDRKNKILLLGLGNEVLKDDGIGPKLVKEISARVGTEYVDVVTSMLGGMETIEMIKDYEKAVIIDGIMTDRGTPGTVYFMKYPYHKNTLHLSNAHDISFDMAMKLAHKINISVPDDIRVIAVEIMEDREFGEELTQPLQDCYDEILNSIVHMIRRDYIDKVPV